MAIQLLFIRRCLQDLFKMACRIFVLFLSRLFSMRFVSGHAVHPYSSADSATVHSPDGDMNT